MFQDLRYGLRLMLRKPGFAAIAVATLALGIGTTTAIFAVTDHVLLRPVPYADPARLAVIWETSPTIQLPVMFASPPNLYEWQQRAKSFSSMGGFQWRDVIMGGAEPERIRAARVTAGLFPSMGVQPQLGRWFLPEEDRAGARPVMVISDRLWQRCFSRNGSSSVTPYPSTAWRLRSSASCRPRSCARRVVPRTLPAEQAERDSACDQSRSRPAQRALLAVIGRFRGRRPIESNRDMNDVQRKSSVTSRLHLACTRRAAGRSVTSSSSRGWPAGRRSRVHPAAGLRERREPVARARCRAPPRVCDSHGACRHRARLAAQVIAEALALASQAALSARRRTACFA